MQDDDLFRSAMSDVAPLPQRQRASSRKHSSARADGVNVETAAARAVARRSRHDEDSEQLQRMTIDCLTLGEVPQVEPDELLAWKKDGVQEGVYRNLRLGKYPIEGALDLHGHTVREARAALFDFLVRSPQARRRTVLVTHGRGARSPTPARLKSYVAHWLRHFPDVIALHGAQRRDGGSGAVYVLLRKSSAERGANRERHGGRGAEQG
jgi:DNA-nicking Smr family endonuclease